MNYTIKLVVFYFSFTGLFFNTSCDFTQYLLFPSYRKTLLTGCAAFTVIHVVNSLYRGGLQHITNPPEFIGMCINNISTFPALKKELLFSVGLIGLGSLLSHAYNYKNKNNKHVQLSENQKLKQFTLRFIDTNKNQSSDLIIDEEVMKYFTNFQKYLTTKSTTTIIPVYISKSDIGVTTIKILFDALQDKTWGTIDSVIPEDFQSMQEITIPYTTPERIKKLIKINNLFRSIEYYQLLQLFGFLTMHTVRTNLIDALDFTLCSNSEPHLPCCSAQEMIKILSILQPDQELYKTFIEHIIKDIVGFIYLENNAFKIDELFAMAQSLDAHYTFNDVELKNFIISGIILRDWQHKNNAYHLKNIKSIITSIKKACQLALLIKKNNSVSMDELLRQLA